MSALLVLVAACTDNTPLPTNEPRRHPAGMILAEVL